MILAEGGPPGAEAVLLWGGVITMVAGLVAGLWRVVRGLVSTWRRLDQYIADWYGEPERPGVPARPGVMERVAGMEVRLGRMEHELHPNGGASLRDAIDEANRRLAVLRACSDDPARGTTGEPDS
ncbi:hypothetical protein [Streptomyces bacillaris]|uniref:hypothetical protein n=1 Tax=Streptomyces bacillaris TaxID=68179 RepID=UPI003629D72F